MKATNASLCRFSLALALLLVSTATSVSAQTVYGSIVGTVTDASSAAISGATVLLTNLGTNESRSAVADDSGNYTFVNLLPASYGITVEKAGFKKMTRQPIQVEVQSAIRIDATLEVGDASQTIAVTAEAPLVQPKTRP